MENLKNNLMDVAFLAASTILALGIALIPISAILTIWGDGLLGIQLLLTGVVMAFSAFCLGIGLSWWVRG